LPRVFAYGSLMGDAVLSRYPAQPARLPDYHRAFVHESRRRWGRPEAPCPILGLARGGECWGVVFEVPPADWRTVRGTLEKREAARERRAERRTVETPAGPVEAWAWISRTSSGNGQALETVEARLRAAQGAVGTGPEYVRALVHAMALHGLRDPLVETLWDRLQD